MEIVAMDMKLRGMYIARQLSFYGVSFKIEEVPLAPEFKKAYDDSVQLVRANNGFTIHSRNLKYMRLMNNFSGWKRCRSSRRRPL